MGFVSVDVSRAIAPHLSVTNGDKVTAKNDLIIGNWNAHTPSLDTTPPPVIYLWVIAKHRHTGTGAAGLHPLRHSADQPNNAFLRHCIQVWDVGKLQARLAITVRQCPAGSTVNYKNAVLHYVLPNINVHCRREGHQPHGGLGWLGKAIRLPRLRLAMTGKNIKRLH